MKQTLFNADVTRKCGYCAHGRLAPTETEILCPVKGVVNKDFVCKKFCYDPLKREPKAAGAPSGFSPDDFTL